MGQLIRYGRYFNIDALNNISVMSGFGVGVEPGNFSGLSFTQPIIDLGSVVNVRSGNNSEASINLGGNTYRKAFISTPDSTDTPYLKFSISASGTSSVCTEAMRMNASRKILVGDSLDMEQSTTSLGVGDIQIQTTSFSSFQLFSSVTSADGSYLLLGKSRGNIASKSILQNNDILGALLFAGYDGSSFLASAAIHAYIDGTPGTTDLPTRVVISVAPDGSASRTDRLTISSSGLVTINGNVDNTGEYRIDGTKVVGNQVSAIASLTDSTGGSDDGTLSAVTDQSETTDNSVINDNFSEIHTKLESILSALRSHGLIAT